MQSEEGAESSCENQFGKSEGGTKKWTEGTDLSMDSSGSVQIEGEKNEGEISCVDVEGGKKKGVDVAGAIKKGEEVGVAV